MGNFSIPNPIDSVTNAHFFLPIASGALLAPTFDSTTTATWDPCLISFIINEPSFS